MPARWKFAARAVLGVYCTFQFATAPFPSVRNIGDPYLDWFWPCMPVLAFVGSYRPEMFSDPFGRLGLVELKLGGEHHWAKSAPRKRRYGLPSS